MDGVGLSRRLLRRGCSRSEVPEAMAVVQVCFKCKGTGNVYEDHGNGFASATACECEAGRLWTGAAMQAVGLTDDVPEDMVIYGHMPGDTGDIPLETGRRFSPAKGRSRKRRGRI